LVFNANAYYGEELAFSACASGGVNSFWKAKGRDALIKVSDRVQPIFLWFISISVDRLRPLDRVEDWLQGIWSILVECCNLVKSGLTLSNIMKISGNTLTRPVNW
jgi:hypothetical protein